MSERNRAHPRLKLAMQIIYSLFEPLLDKPDLKNPKTFIDASEFEEKLRGIASRPIIIKAKRLMGIKSVRIAGKYRWRIPKRAPEAALQALHKKRVDSLEREAARQIFGSQDERYGVITLRSVMKELHYDAISVDVLKSCLARGVAARTARRAKKLLDISSVFGDDGHWHWVWMPDDREVELWLEERLRNGPRSIESIVEQAKSEKQWSLLVLRETMDRVGGIKVKKHEGKMCWYDVDTVSSNMEGEVMS